MEIFFGINNVTVLSNMVCGIRTCDRVRGTRTCAVRLSGTSRASRPGCAGSSGADHRENR